MKPIRLIFFGTGAFAVPALRFLAADPHYEVLLVVTQPDRPQGRKKERIPSPVKKVAQEFDITVFQPESVKDTYAIKEIAYYDPDVTILAAYGQIVPQELLDIAPKGMLNLHGSLLPQLRGASPIQTAILEGFEETGVTLMLVDEKMDHGHILAKRSLVLTGTETTPMLEEKIASIAAELLENNLSQYIEGSLKPQEQDHDAATFCKIIKKEDGLIDWKKGAQEINQQIRAYTPWPGSYTFFNEKKLTIHKASVSQEQSQLPPGTVFRFFGKTSGVEEERRDGSTPDVEEKKQKNLILISCGTGSLILEEVQLEGKRSLKIEEFIRGYPKFVDLRLMAE